MKSVACGMCRSILLSVCCVIGLGIFVSPIAMADWTDIGNVNGVQVYRDNFTGLEWTTTIGQVQSSGWGAPAQSLVAKYGFRLPSFRELQVMESHGGFGRLGIKTAMQQYYETSDSGTLAAAWGNGFKTPQQRKAVGMNWVIGVRNAVDEQSDSTTGTVSTSTPVITSTKPKVNVVITQKVKPVPVVTSNTSKPSGNALPVLPNYDN